MEIHRQFSHNKIRLIENQILFQFYIEAGLILAFIICPHCQISLPNSYSVSNCIRCYMCNVKLSIYALSIFFNNKFSLNQFHYILISFLNNESIKHVNKCFSDSEIPLSKKTIGKYYSIFRKLLIAFMENFLENVNFSGICEIDEALITAKRIGNNGRLPSFRIWVFGILERNSGNCVLYLVPNRRKNLCEYMFFRFFHNIDERLRQLINLIQINNRLFI